MDDLTKNPEQRDMDDANIHNSTIYDEYINGSCIGIESDNSDEDCCLHACIVDDE